MLSKNQGNGLSSWMLAVPRAGFLVWVLSILDEEPHLSSAPSLAAVTLAKGRIILR